MIERKIVPRNVFTTKKRVRRVPKALGSNVENGFGVIFLHANEIIMRALRAYQKQAFISLKASRDVIQQLGSDHHRHLQTFPELWHANQQNAQHHVNISKQGPL